MSENTVTIVEPNIETAEVKFLIDLIRKTVKGRGKWSAYVELHDVTLENFKKHAEHLADMAYPNDEKVQKRDGNRTDYGNALNTAKCGLKKALDLDENENKPVALITRAGAKASWEEVKRAWEAAQAEGDK